MPDDVRINKLLSIVIPVKDDLALASFFDRHAFAVPRVDVEWIVVDVSARVSVDRSWPNGVRYVHAPWLNNRADALIRGCQDSLGEIVLLMHADCTLPSNFLNRIVEHMQSGYESGAFYKRYDDPRLVMVGYAWLLNTLLRYKLCLSGTNGLFLSRSCLNRMGGVAQVPFMEDIELGRQMLRHTRFAPVCDTMLVSARQYICRWPGIKIVSNLMVYLLFLMGVNRELLARMYRWRI